METVVWRADRLLVCQLGWMLDQLHNATEEFPRRATVHYAVIHGQAQLQGSSDDELSFNHKGSW